MGTDPQPQPNDTPLRTLPVVIFPGINNTAATWEPVLSALHAAGLEAQAYDLPAIDSTADIVEALAPSLPERFTLIGHSFGGYVALELLATHPGRVAAICLVNSSDGADSPAAQDNRRASIEAAKSGSYADLAAGATAKAYHPQHLDDAEMMAARKKDVEQYGPERFIAHQAASAARLDHRQTLTDAAQSKLVVAATEDTVIPTAAQKAMAEDTGAAYMEIGPAGHMLPAEQPAELAAALAAWLA